MPATITPAARFAAKQMGRAAFNRGLPAASARDPGMMRMLADKPSAAVLPLLEAWAEGWHAANIAAPIPGWTAEENAALSAARSV